MDLSTKAIVIPPGSWEEFVDFPADMEGDFPYGGILMAAYCRYHPGYRVCYPGAKRHNVVFCRSGEFRFVCDGEQGVLHPGEMFVMPGGTSQAFWTASETESMFFLVEPGGRPVPGLLHTPVRDMGLVYLLMKRMKRLKSGQAAAEARLILTILAEAMGGGEAPPGPGDSVLAQLCHKLRSRPSHPWTIDEMARFCHLSKPQFFVVWRREMRQTPHQFLTGLRMAQAKVLLERTSYPVKSIAALCGFDQLFSFSRAFHHFFQTTPTDYRRQAHRSPEP